MEQSENKSQGLTIAIFVVLAAAVLLHAVQFTRVMTQSGFSVSMLLAIFLCIVGVTLNAYGIILTRQGRAQSAGYSAIFGNPVLLLIMSLFKADNSVILGLTVMVSLSVVATNLLPKQKTALGVLVSFIGGSMVASMNVLRPLPGSSLFFFAPNQFIQLAVVLFFSVVLFVKFPTFTIGLKLVTAVSYTILVSAGALLFVNVTALKKIAGITPEQLITATNGFVITTAVLLALSATAAYLLSQSVSQQLRKLSDVSFQIADQGNLNFQMEHNSQDEIGDVERNFSHMSTFLKTMASTAQRISEYDLTSNIAPRGAQDTFGQAFQKTVSVLNDFMHEMVNASDKMNIGADQVAASGKTLSQGTVEQAASLEEISASIKEISGQARNNEELAKNALQVSKQAKLSSTASTEKVQELSRAITEINKTAAGIKSLSKVIDDIAFQINLLALNAAIEAARAGKYGKGFSVVADEVRRLASRSAESSKEATNLVDTVFKRLDKSTDAATQMKTSIQAVDSITEKIGELSTQISAASEEQALSLEAIKTGLDQINHVTQTTASCAEESSSTAEMLASTSHHVRALVHKFTLNPH